MVDFGLGKGSNIIALAELYHTEDVTLPHIEERTPYIRPARFLLRLIVGELSSPALIAYLRIDIELAKRECRNCGLKCRQTLFRHRLRIQRV